MSGHPCIRRIKFPARLMAAPRSTSAFIGARYHPRPLRGEQENHVETRAPARSLLKCRGVPTGADLEAHWLRSKAVDVAEHQIERHAPLIRFPVVRAFGIQ